MNESLRLNKHLAHQLGISRREADELIEAGQVSVNGMPAILGSRILPTDELAVRNKPLQKRQGFSYIVLNKPVGYVCSRRRQGDTPTIYELLPEELHRLKPVGRLDKDSSGLLLLTDDGDFAHSMTHPSFHKTKAYEITLNQPLAPLHRQMISDHGITLEDGISQLQLERQADGDDSRWIVRMHEGRNRQIRRTFEALSYTVTELHRTHFGPYSLDSLQSGTFSTFVL